MPNKTRPNNPNEEKAPACVHLGSKGMYVTGQLNPADDYEGHGDGNCWCLKTQNVIGPDDGLVERELCDRTRSCYEPLP
jgi:hypothetical protein